ncbi:hypothetical protein K7432_001360 [Basidiobolus ranarum]|uniref:Uncharacterized protein n=1 Tax=Basidiobolus ranarum TaxID=34480 RepID=A0ABR2W9Q3_9FUNG
MANTTSLSFDFFPTPSIKSEPNFRRGVTAATADVESSVRAMDSIYSTNFHDWVRNHQNVLCIAARLRTLSSECDLRRLAMAMQWIASEWPESRCKILFKSITVGWEERKRRQLAMELLFTCKSTDSRWSWKPSYPNIINRGSSRCVRSMRLRRTNCFSQQQELSENELKSGIAHRQPLSYESTSYYNQPE